MSSHRFDRVIVVGLDGLEPTIVEELFARGELPHLASLASEGGYRTITTTNPAQTPVAWSSFATGSNPGVHGIFDFVGRDPETYRLELALNSYDQSNPFRAPRVVNRRKGSPFWEDLSQAGIPSSILRCPCSYPPDPIEGRMLSGMGVPDLRGSFGTGTFYSTERGLTEGEAEQLVTLPQPVAGQAVETFLIGPRHPRTRANARVPIVLEPGSESGSFNLRSSGEPDSLILRRGVWSDWLRVSFKLGLLQSVSGLVRFVLVDSADEQLSLYASPIQFDPVSPPFPISHPESFSAELYERLGSYHTTGLPEDHAALSNGRIDERTFLHQCDDLWREREQMFESELGRFDSGVLFCLFDMTDRIQHLFWRYREPDHPTNRRNPRIPGSESAIAEAYRRADRVVGLARDAADDRTLVLALSDHGFGSFRRGFNVNTWLHEQGWLSLESGVAPGDSIDSPLGGIDWQNTRAYSIGLAGIYLNLKGREGSGAVDPDDAETVKESLCQALHDAQDPSDGRPPLRSVKPRESCYHGPAVTDAPDLILSFSEGYRASWGSALGNLSSSCYEDNTRLWAGDHIVDPELVPGVLFANHRLAGSGAPSLLDLAPTILEAFGLPPGTNRTGRSVLE